MIPKRLLASIVFLTALLLPISAFAAQVYSQADTSLTTGTFDLHGHGYSAGEYFLHWVPTTSGTFDGNTWLYATGETSFASVNVLYYKGGISGGDIVSSQSISLTDGVTQWYHGNTAGTFSYTAGDDIYIGFDDASSGDYISLFGSSAVAPNTMACSTGATYCAGIGSIAFAMGGTSTPVPDTDTSTRIIDFTPEDATTTSNPVTFSLHAYVNPVDISGGYTITFTLHNIDQNVLLLSALSPNDIVLLSNVEATSSGDFYFSTTTTIAEGNYRINAVLQKNTLWGFVKDPFSPVNENLSHQFVVGTPTLIGSLTQNGYSELNGYLASSTATSSISLVESSCDPISGFSMTDCLTGLLIPDSNALQTTIEGFQAGVLTRAPWGYFTRVYQIFNSTTTTELPSYTATVALNNASDTTTISIDPGDMLAGAAALLASTTDPYNGMDIRQVAEPIVQLFVALVVLFTIIADIAGSHKHQSAESSRTKRT